MTRHLLVVAHEATRTGSPRVLLELLRYAAPRLEAQVDVRLLAGGGLAAELTAMTTATERVATPTAVLVNGAAAAGELLRVVPGVPTVVYVHEEGTAIDVLHAGARDALASRADVVLCVSENSRRDLVALGVPADRIELLPPVVVAQPAPSSEASASASATAGVPEGGRLVVGCGEAGWRKGADLFVDVARRLASRPDVSFAWVGSGPRSFHRILAHDTSVSGLATRLRWVGEVDDAGAYLHRADVLVFPSREDPRPLVPLEAAVAGTPTVGFRVGGVAAMEAEGTALACPYPDTVALAALAGSLLDDADRAAELVARARQVVAEERSIDVLGARFVDVLDRALRGAVAA